MESRCLTTESPALSPFMAEEAVPSSAITPHGTKAIVELETNTSILEIKVENDGDANGAKDIEGLLGKCFEVIAKANDDENAKAIEQQKTTVPVWVQFLPPDLKFVAAFKTFSRRIHDPHNIFEFGNQLVCLHFSNEIQCWGAFALSQEDLVHPSLARLAHPLAVHAPLEREFFDEEGHGGSSNTGLLQFAWRISDLRYDDPQFLDFYDDWSLIKELVKHLPPHRIADNPKLFRALVIRNLHI